MNCITKNISVISACALITCLSGCLSTGSSGSSSSTPEPEEDYQLVDNSLTNDEVNFFSSSGYKSCFIGAATGAATCLLLGGNALQCTLSAVGGCVVTMGGNYFLDKLRASNKSKEEKIDEVAEAIKKDNALTSKLVANAKTSVAKEKKEIAQLEKDIKKGKADKVAVENKQKKLDQTIAWLTKQRDEAKKHYESISNTRMYLNEGKLSSNENVKAKDLDKELKIAENNIKDLNSTLDEYSRQRDSLKVSAKKLEIKSKS